MFASNTCLREIRGGGEPLGNRHTLIHTFFLLLLLKLPGAKPDSGKEGHLELHHKKFVFIFVFKETRSQPILNNNKGQKAELGVARLAKCLPNMYKALSLISSTI